GGCGGGAPPPRRGPDPPALAPVVPPEPAHPWGGGPPPAPAWVMSAARAPATARRSLTVPDLNIPDPPAGADALTAAMPAAGPVDPGPYGTPTAPVATPAVSTPDPVSGSPLPQPAWGAPGPNPAGLSTRVMLAPTYQARPLVLAVVPGPSEHVHRSWFGVPTLWRGSRTFKATVGKVTGRHPLPFQISRAIPTTSRLNINSHGGL